ncbi:hypothetical protein [Mesorhizobium sp.]|uniref:hypothetical protein n=1 Tax=Mesorhizobium sp. TaxID=1871066 RepID=UPI00257BA089|nr:hypothetical protein [Mesorhizobium sp.]
MRSSFEDKTHPYNVLSRERRREFKERKAEYDAERKDIEQRTGYGKMDRAYTRQIFRAGRAADKVLFHPARSLADLAVKARVNKVWDY